MEKLKIKQVVTFEDFCKSRKSNLIQENSSVEITVPFWDDAVQFAVDDLRTLAGCESPIDWGYLVDKIKQKFALLNIFDKGLVTDDSFIIAHVKDILYQRFAADGFLSGETGGAENYNSADLGVKAFILSKLADTVLHKVRVEAGLEKEPVQEDPKPVATVSLENGYYDCDDDDYDCLPFEYHGVVGFDDFNNIIKEGVDRLTCQDDGKGLDYCLDKIKSDAGSLKLDDILRYADEEDYQDVNAYLLDIANDYLKDVKIELNGRELSKRGDEKIVLKTAKKFYARWIVQELLGKIKKETV